MAIMLAHGGPAIGGFEGFESGTFQGEAHYFADVRVVVGYEYCLHGRSIPRARRCGRGSKAAAPRLHKNTGLLRNLRRPAAFGLVMMLAMPFALTRLPTRHLASLVLPGACLLALGLEPLLWLIQTWYAPGYEGIGFWAFCCAAGLLIWSVSSAPIAPRAHAARLRRVAPLLLCSLLIRLLGVLSGVDLISALVLALDVYALAVWCDIAGRQRPVAPLWLALVFCFSLPLEPLLQRSGGFALQQVSAWLACGLLDGLGFDSQCQGVRMRIAATDVLVDLPCSGARLASFGGLMFAVLAALRSPTRWASAMGLVLLLVLVAVGNALRIALLALGIAYAASWPVAVMSEPWHSLIGLLALAGVAAGLWCWFVRTPAAPKAAAPEPAITTGAARRAAWSSALVLSLALLLPWLQTPFDQPASATALAAAQDTLPAHLGGFARTPAPLGAMESAYFERYGARAARGTYGPHGLYVVRTNAPLRHLHAPEICLRGMGHRVEFIGTAFDGVPRSRFRSTDRAGNSYRVEVSYLSASGTVASSIAEVIWRWVQAPREHWTMIQRITPEHVPQQDFEHAVQRAFNLPVATLF